MKKLLVLGLVAMFVMTAVPVFADGFEELIKGNDPDDPVTVTVGVAKIIDVPEASYDIRLQIDRESDIGNISNGQLNLSCIVEF